jgi:(4-(4-[2-(gamma-L-glutamylamino)ethyl]phenoxymethyl)furan-2-yl)methanamine synthase
MTVIGWDIGGVNTKVSRVEAGRVIAVCGRPFELQRAPAALVPLLRELADDVGGPGFGLQAPDSSFEASGSGFEASNSGLEASGSECLTSGPAFHCAVTMTAELSQMFRTKREGVAFVLDALEAAFPAARICIYAVDGRFLPPAQARQEPLAVAAANWAATARLAATQHPDALLVDVGTTTTDIVPIVGGIVVAEGLTDPDRLASGELVYTGALRTPVEALASHVPLGAGFAGVSAEGFALAGDVHVWRGELTPEDYTVPTPDGRPATRECAGERLARVLCADRELLDEAAISSIADALAAAQVARITAAIARVAAAHPSIRVAVVTGLGAFLGTAAARAAGLQVLPLAEELGETAARCAPAVAVALLLEREIAANFHSATPNSQLPTPNCQLPTPNFQLPISNSRTPPANVGLPGKTTRGIGRWESGAGRCEMPQPADVDVVVKLGGGVLAHAGHFAAVLAVIAAAAPHRRVLIVPGGGPFADAVRDVDRRLGLPDDAAHWMAVLAMDQYAHVVAARLEGGVVVADRGGINAAVAARRVPVLAPSRWLEEMDPLPHAWDVTSDSIAAWFVGVVGARRLVLVKPPGAAGGDLVDAFFFRTLPRGITSAIITADQMEALRVALVGPDDRGPNH